MDFFIFYIDHMFREVIKFMKYDKLIANDSGRPKSKRTRPLKRSQWCKPSRTKVKPVLSTQLNILNIDLQTMNN